MQTWLRLSAVFRREPAYCLLILGKCHWALHYVCYNGGWAISAAAARCALSCTSDWRKKPKNQPQAVHPSCRIKAPNVLQQLQLTLLLPVKPVSTFLHCEDQLSQGWKRGGLLSGSAVRLSIAPLMSLHSKQTCIYTNTLVCTFLFTWPLVHIYRLAKYRASSSTK